MELKELKSIPIASSEPLENPIAETVVRPWTSVSPRTLEDVWAPLALDTAFWRMLHTLTGLRPERPPSPAMQDGLT